MFPRVLTPIALLFLHSGVSLAVQPCEMARLTPSDAGTGGGEGFGWSVAVSGDWIVVGAPYDLLDDPEGDYPTGAAYFFQREGNQWTEKKKVKGSQATAVDSLFWESVSIDGEWAVIGSPHRFPTGPKNRQA